MIDIIGVNNKPDAPLPEAGMETFLGQVIRSFLK